ncbi:MAG: transporter substrate-binding domain-containing protein [Coriobacteriales bacterium]|jgi:polar amino acid transport system substrate-binding protein|nr:transporter substrate-binding domain-containing protein [Coriobacteriales bacterium]
MNQVKRVNKIINYALAFLMALSLLVMSGCAGITGSKELAQTPTIASPTIGVDGVLRVGVDSTKVPYAGYPKDKSRQAENLVGIDVDIAAALAEQLGLKLQLVDVAGMSAEELFSSKAIDGIMDVEQTTSSTVKGTQVGPYILSGPALFAVVKSDKLPNVELSSLAGTKIAAQKDSLSSWSLEELIGAGTADQRQNLDAAFTALQNGEVSYAAADAVMGSYLALEYNSVSCVKIMGTPIGICMVVPTDNTQLADTLTGALRSIRDNGVLKTVLSKWFGQVSASVLMGSTAITSQEANSSGAPSTNGTQIDTGEDLPDPSNA